MNNKLFSEADFKTLLSSLQSNKEVFLDGIYLSKEILPNIDKYSNLSSLLESWPKDIDSYLPGIADEVNSATTNKEVATKNYKEGRALLFNDANIVFEDLQNLTDLIMKEIGFSNLSIARSLLYAVPANNGTDAHFDQNFNFVFQLQGEKKWWIAPNEDVINPLTRYTIGTEPEPELASYANSLPREFPMENAKEYTLKEGSFLFVPKGAWHKTESIGADSLALNFTYSVPSWTDLLLSALRGKLALDEKWRQSALFVNHPDYSFEAMDEFDDLLALLPYDSPNWTSQSILHITEGRKF